MVGSDGVQQDVGQKVLLLWIGSYFLTDHLRKAPSPTIFMMKCTPEAVKRRVQWWWQQVEFSSLHFSFCIAFNHFLLPSCQICDPAWISLLLLVYCPGLEIDYVLFCFLSITRLICFIKNNSGIYIQILVPPKERKAPELWVQLDSKASLLKHGSRLKRQLGEIICGSQYNELCSLTSWGGWFECGKSGSL